MSTFALNGVDSEKCFIIHKKNIEKRLDPFYYIPSIVELEKKVQKLNPKPLRDYVIHVSSGATPKTTEAEKYYSDAENGIPFLRVQNLSPTGLLELDECKYINLDTHENYLKRSQVSGGDLLVKITGVGRMAVASVAPEGFEGNTNQHMVVIKTESREVSEILAAYLNTDIGEVLASKRSTGGTRPALDYPALLSIPIVYDKKILEIYKQAIKEKQEKEAESEKLLKSVDAYLLNELGIKLPEQNNDISNRIFIINLSEISNSRLDPMVYTQYTKSLKNSILQSKYPTHPLKKFITHSIAGDWGSEEKNIKEMSLYSKCLVIRATEFDNNFNLRLFNSRVKHRYISKVKLSKIDIQPNDILIEKSGGSPQQPVGRVAFLNKDIINKHTLCYSNFLHKLRVNNKVINPEYLFYFLKTAHKINLTSSMQSQTNGLRNLIMSTYFNQEIPLPEPEIQKNIADNIKSIHNQAKQLRDESNTILANAKKEIEKIILGE